ncbi:MAG: 1,4-alpha-glucan branching protein GlgB, partial [Actinomycetota bacterium]|nr:1,4-alpha-glucan branching protein GlgB [Actinomycetota bacterium]
VDYGPGRVFLLEDPFRFGPTVTGEDLDRVTRGRHERLWEVLGAHVRATNGVAGTSFAVWAPNARAVRVEGDFNGWDGRLHPMRRLDPGGVWEIFVPGVAAGARYKFELVTADGRLLLKADPLAFAADLPPGTASVVHESTHRWSDEDGEWLAQRRTTNPLGQRLSVYEVHLGSWRQGLDYRRLAVELVDHVAGLGFTHVELLPVAEHPYGPSWGYQVSGYFAPTARYGTPDDFRALVDAFHRRGIGVLVDWVPAHFPRDDWALAHFDGSPLYEHPDPRRGEHPDWGTNVFDYGRPEVANFLRANTRFWIEELHVDGLRVDAVASMLYLDYSRGDGAWAPNVHGGRENLEAVAFLQELTTGLRADGEGVLVVAEESTTWPGVSGPVETGGLGFTHKWNMGWMHDTLRHFSRPPAERPRHHHELTFGLTYAFSEHFVLPLSHDEVVHGKGTLLTRMPGDRPHQLADLRALFGWMWALPGAPLLFMGGELGQDREWASDRSLDWHLLEHAGHAGVAALVRTLNRVTREEAALWSGDYEPVGFEWIDADDAEGSCYAFLRLAVGDHAGARPVVCLANLTDRPRHGYRVGLPRGGGWDVVVNTDAADLGGSGTPVGPQLEAEPVAWQGRDHSALLTLPPLAVLWLAPRP